MAVLADVIARNEAQDAALDVLLRELGDADHLATAGGDVAGARPCRPAADAWRAAIRRALPAEYQGAQLDGGTATWLWRTLRSVEAAGLDAEQVAADAIASAPADRCARCCRRHRCPDPPSDSRARPGGVAAVVGTRAAPR